MKTDMKTNKRDGFTLIELLIVIAIIGILASVVLSSLANARFKALDTSFKSTAVSVQRAMIFCCGLPGKTLGHTPGAEICSGGEYYPGADSIGSISVADCDEYDNFSKVITPGTNNTGRCVSATLTQNGVTFDGC